jgi:hypothetical protein
VAAYKCTYCGKPATTREPVPKGKKIECAYCYQTFTVAQEHESTPIDHIHLNANNESLPPTDRKGRNKVKPELHGNFYSRMESSRTSVMIGLGLVLAGCVAVFINWYTSKIDELKNAGERAAKGHNERIARESSASANKEHQQEQRAKRKELIEKAKPTTEAKPTLADRQATPPPRPELVIPQAPSYESMVNNPGGLKPPPKPALPSQSSSLATAEQTPKVADPEAEKKAASKLYLAERLLKDGKQKLGSYLLQELVTDYPDTEAAITGRRLLGSTATKRAELAQKLLIRGNALRRTNSLAEARLDYQAILDRYPETPQAKLAKKYLDGK